LPAGDRKYGTGAVWGEMMSLLQNVGKKVRVYGRRLWGKRNVRLRVLAVLVFLTMAIVLSMGKIPRPVDLEAGQVALADIESPRTAVNRVKTNERKDEAARAAVKEAGQNPDNYEINQAITVMVEETVHDIFASIESERAAVRQAASSDKDTEAGGPAPETAASETNPSETIAEESIAPVAENLQQELRARYELELDREVMKRILVLGEAEFSESRGRLVDTICGFIRTQRITEQDKRDRVQELQAKISNLNLEAPLKDLGVAVASVVVRPNLVLSPEKVERARQRAVDSVDPVMILKNQTIVRKGDIVTAEQISILRDLGLLSRHTNYLVVFGIILTLLLLFALVIAYLSRYAPEMLHDVRLCALLALVTVVITSLAKLLSFIPWPGSAYLIPTGFGTMLISILLDSRLAMIMSVVMAVIVAVATDNSLPFFLVSLATGLMAVLSVSKISQRSDLTRSGFVVGITGFITMITIGLLRQDGFILKNSYLGVANGLFSAIACIGFLPYVESLFGITSAIKLLELCNPNQPLLRRLLVEAPGTYHHSIIVGNLAEAAAEAIGADGLLARVGATYHDIGKIRRPYFFIENQLGDDNPHDKILPSLSTLIITSHVKDGVELARQHKLPGILVDFIREHHGTSLLGFFYHRAAEHCKDGSIVEADFRYPGPRPQAREVVIVMLADSVEAAVRSLSRPTPGRIEGLVRRIIKDKLSDGQLDKSDLTFKDLDAIAGAFVRVLSGIFHSRVEYPKDLQELARRRQANG